MCSDKISPFHANVKRKFNSYIIFTDRTLENVKEMNTDCGFTWLGRIILLAVFLFAWKEYPKKEEKTHNFFFFLNFFLLTYLSLVCLRKLKRYYYSFFYMFLQQSVELKRCVFLFVSFSLADLSRHWFPSIIPNYVYVINERIYCNITALHLFIRTFMIMHWIQSNIYLLLHKNILST